MNSRNTAKHLRRILCLSFAFLLCISTFISCTETSTDPTPTPTDAEPSPTQTPTQEPTATPSPSPTEVVKKDEPNTAPLIRQSGRFYNIVTADLQTSQSNQDKAYLKMTTGDATDSFRFADGTAQIIYQFNIRKAYEPTVAFEVANNFKIEVSADRKKWQLVTDWMENHPENTSMSNYTTIEINPYDYEIYDMLYVRFSDSNISNGWGPAIFRLVFTYYEKSDIESLNIFNLNEEGYKMLYSLLDGNDPSAVDAYDIASDNGLIYNPISREKADQLTKYNGKESLTGTFETTYNNTKITVKYSVPKVVTAYDAMPIVYEITADKNVSTQVYLVATAFEDAEREHGTTYDLSIPGTVDLTWEYLGTVGGKNNASNRSVVSNSDTRDKQGTYPQYTTTDLVYSGNIAQADTHWFKFQYTNTGNTVLDGDGTGTFCIEPFLYKKNASGSWEQCASAENMYYRFVDEVYPGETGEMYFTFNASNLAVGDYKIILNGIVRNETANPENYGKNIWGGEVYTFSEFTFKISANGADETPNQVVKSTPKSASRNRWLHRYEEFMTSFDTYLTGMKAAETVSDTMYLQCAPWTNQVVLKLIIGTSTTIKTVSIPVQIETDSIKVTFNPDNNNYVVLDDGTRFPAISAQSMADMRGNVQLGPDAASNVLDNLTAMMDCGVNLINTTAAFEFDSSYSSGIANNIDACWFSLDCARKLGLKVEGWITYPYESAGTIGQANSLFKTSFSDTNYGSTDLPASAALCALWQYTRWGDNFWIGGNNTVVFDIEDTRGWMRIDFNAREPMSEKSKINFRYFLMDLYGSDIEVLNEEWGTSFTSFNDIDPEMNSSVEAHGWKEYKNSAGTIKEWSLPMAQLDAFRTLERVKDYQTILSTLAENNLTTAKINLRTEGANWIASVDPDTENAHYRHVYYSQRRCGIIPELVAQGNVLYASSDYTTLPYTPSEVAELTQRSVESGIVPMLLPQFDRMRDIAVNTKYGNDFTCEYNLEGSATRGVYINTVCSVFEWFRATYENGGVPGILWQDYLCDGYATSTQRKEIAFFTEKLKEALNTPEGKKWAKEFTQDTSVLSGSAGKWTFKESDIQAIIDEYLDK